MQRTLLILLVAASYLLFAGAQPWTLQPLLGLAVVCVLVAPRRTLSFPRSWRLLDWSLIAIALGIALQLIPMPHGLVAALSPNHDRVRSALEFATAAGSGWTTLSIHPRLTLNALGTVVLGILSFWVARAVFGAGGNTRQFCRALAVFGAAVAVAAIVQKAVTPRLVLFMVQPDARSASPFGAFVNRNHFAAWLLLIVAPVCGYMIAHLRIHPSYRGRWRESTKQFLGSGVVITALATIVMVGVLFATLSRSAVAGLAAAALCGWLLGRRRVRIERSSLPTILGFAGLALFVAVLFIDIGGWAARLEQSLSNDPGEYSRLSIWGETVPIIRDFWLTGAGAGTYSDAMTQYQQSRVWVVSMQRWAHFNNAHSHFIQVASEGGLLLLIPAATALTLLVTLGRRAIHADKGEMFWVRVGAAAGLFGLAVQSIWEVSLTMPANAVLSGVLVGLMLHHRDSARSTPPSTDELIAPKRLRMA